MSVTIHSRFATIAAAQGYQGASYVKDTCAYIGISVASYNRALKGNVKDLALLERGLAWGEMMNAPRPNPEESLARLLSAVFGRKETG